MFKLIMKRSCINVLFEGGGGGGISDEGVQLLKKEMNIYSI